MRKRLFLVGIALAAVLAGCGGGGGSTSQLADPRVRFANASCDSTALNLQVDDGVIVTGLGYAALAPVNSIAAGEHDFITFENGSTTQIDSEVATTNPDTDYFVVQIGLENFGTEYAKRAREIFFNRSVAAPNGSKSTIIFVHGFNRGAGNDTPAVDLKPPGDNAVPVLTNIAYGSNQSATIDSGSHEYVVQRNGTSEVYIDVTFNFLPGKVYLALASGIQGSVTTPPRLDYIQLN